MVGQSNDDLVIKIASLEKAVSQHTTTLDDVLVKKVAKLQTEVVKKMVGQSNDVLVTEMNSTTKKIAEIEQSLQNIDKLGTELKHLVNKVTQVETQTVLVTGDAKLIKKLEKRIQEVAKEAKTTDDRVTKVVKTMVGQSNDQTVEGVRTELKHLVDQVTQVETDTDINTYMLHAITCAVQLTQTHPLVNEVNQQFYHLSDYISRREEVILKDHPDHWDKALDIFME